MEVWLSLKMSYSLTIVNRRTTDDSVNLITLLKQELGEITSVLSGNTGNQCNFSFHFSYIVSLFIMLLPKTALCAAPQTACR